MFIEGTYYNFGLRIFFMSLFRRVTSVLFGFVVLIAVSYLPKFIQETSALKGILKTIKIENIEHIVKLILIYGSIFLVLVIIIIVVIEWIKFNSHQFMLDKFALRIRSGFLTRSEVAIPYSVIQTVNLNESIMDRTYGTASLFILTAGNENQGEESSGAFETIDSKLARALQEELLNRSSNQGPITYTPSTSLPESEIK